MPKRRQGITTTLCVVAQKSAVRKGRRFVHKSRVTESGFGPLWKKNLFSSRPPPPSRGRPAKNLSTESERLTVSCRVTWAWTERANWYSRQIMILPITNKNMQHSRFSGPFRTTGPPFGPPDPLPNYRVLFRTTGSSSVPPGPLPNHRVPFRITWSFSGPPGRLPNHRVLFGTTGPPSEPRGSSICTVFPSRRHCM